MIIGIGIDLVDIRRIEKILKREGTRFEKRVFTKNEQKKALSRKQTMAATYAKRFAAKEACIKALGTRTADISWLDMDIGNEKSGAPTLTLRGKALKHLKKITPKGARAKIFISLSDEYPYAMAQVIISAGHD